MNNKKPFSESSTPPYQMNQLNQLKLNSKVNEAN